MKWPAKPSVMVATGMIGAVVPGTVAMRAVLLSSWLTISIPDVYREPHCAAP
jgi:hypothetical protein